MQAADHHNRRLSSILRLSINAQPTAAAPRAPLPLLLWLISQLLLYYYHTINVIQLVSFSFILTNSIVKSLSWSLDGAFLSSPDSKLKTKNDSHRRRHSTRPNQTKKRFSASIKTPNLADKPSSLRFVDGASCGNFRTTSRRVESKFARRIGFAVSGIQYQNAESSTSCWSAQDSIHQHPNKHDELAE